MALSADYINDAARLPCNGCSNRPECLRRESTCIAYNKYIEGRKWSTAHRIPNKNINMDLFDVHSITLC